jgi:3-methylfumaryl-CoA hydratase
LNLQSWVGRTQSQRDTPTALRVAELAATLDDPREYPAGTEIPAGWHWILFHSIGPTAILGPDGHLPRGAFLPPVTLPRRMWAGGSLRFHKALRVDEPVERESEVISVTEKAGRNGQLVFVTVKHELRGPGGLAIEEDQDIVYREASAGAATPPPPPHRDAPWEAEIRPNEALLFRYSALIFNAHRIHYDRDYATRVEGYGGLVVHGPLTATWLLELARKNGRRVRTFSYRGVAPLFDGAPIRVRGFPAGNSADLWAETPRCELAMIANAELAP